MEVQTASDKVKLLKDKRVGIFGKGGSGKSTAAILLARELSYNGYSVCILDADSTNVGLPQALGLAKSPLALIDYFGGMVFSGGSVTCPVDDPTPLAGAKISLKHIPAEYYGHAEGIYLFTAGKIGDQGPGAGCDGPISKIARDFSFQIEGEEVVTLVDFKAGFEDTSRGAITSLDWAIVIVDPTYPAIELAASMKQMVDRIKAGEPPATEHLKDPETVALANRIFREARIRGVLFILNRIKSREAESYLRARLAEKGLEPSGIIHEDPAIASSWLRGLPLDVTNRKQEAARIIVELEAAAGAGTP
ncbi:MAG: P-loop NTPase [Candidatus Neomarinimicrobiota bacterium]